MSQYVCEKCGNRYDNCTCDYNKGKRIKSGDYVIRRAGCRDPEWGRVCKLLGKKSDATFKVIKDESVGSAIILEGIEKREWYAPFFERVATPPVVPESNNSNNNMVTQPKHYEFFDGVEAITIIARSMTEKQFAGYCMGNALKYRLRAGKKFNTEEDLKKADYYKELFQKHRHECIDEDI
ncbi:hypothetical protein mutPK1A2_p30 [Escherichia phage mutPK1A2]|uniref:Nucleotide kinase n=1 Tax=Escherichia phage mutPK1A2 TaxID=2783800 RepID=A0A2H4N054_9CAUD|nr:nucleotide kinase [Escherichia phage mutPK1A2]ATS93330.1 hypothetical protein mutPK1A2_p30 [Escherichia phage mutPK1A2]